MKIGILKENKANEMRVAIVPSTISALSKKGYEFFIETDSGLNANYSNEEYKNAPYFKYYSQELFEILSSILAIFEITPFTISLKYTLSHFLKLSSSINIEIISSAKHELTDQEYTA